MVRLYNTLTKQVSDFTPLTNGEVTFYSCGPTVYDHAHIGNLASYITADTLHRVLQSSGLKVKRVMNYTDIDDKTIARSQKEHPDLEPHEALTKLTRKYEDLFIKDMQAIGNDIDGITFVRATESIDDMQQLIRELHKSGIAYIADDGVYFSLEEYRKRHIYGQLSTISEASTATARINNDEYDKSSIHDFALWKVKKTGEPSWPFELDGKPLDGRPGWHIECSAMSTKHLGQPFDIHTGGVDLIFPHHENEIAQSTATTEDDRFAVAFVHNEHVLVDGHKMSKSLNNFFTLEDIAGHNIDPLAFRLLVLQGHYRHQLNFSWESLEAATKRLTNLRNFAALQYQTGDANDSTSPDVVQAWDEILAALQDDLNTPQALARLSSLVTNIETNGLGKRDLSAFVKLLGQLDEVFGLQLTAVHDVDESVKDLINQREQARQKQDFTAADNLRQKLTEQKIAVRDTDNGPIWSRI